jgi:hypothetical protein
MYKSLYCALCYFNYMCCFNCDVYLWDLYVFKVWDFDQQQDLGEPS